MRLRILFAGALSVSLSLHAQTLESWKTFYELSGFLKTPRYDQTIAYCKRLAVASPWVKYEAFGVSPQGRELPLLIVSRDQAFTPAKARKTGKAIILVQSGIHAGEIDGKDASLMLIRDIVVTRRLVHLLDHTILLFVPIFNVDGHERFGAYNRINQNGPDEMGWRVTAQNLNLNRDYMKADAPEMRAMLRLFTAWLPDLYIDCHVTDGIDFQYDVTYTMETGPNIDKGISQWISGTLLPAVLPQVKASGHKIFAYVFPREDRDLSKGLNGGASTPRFSTGYAALQNRPSLLIETHMLKPYRTRVGATYELLRAMIDVVDSGSAELRQVVRRADDATIAAAPGSTLPLAFGLGPDSTILTFLGFASTTVIGAISGDRHPVFSAEPKEISLPFFNDPTITDSVAMPRLYLIPPEWTSVRDVLVAHGMNVKRLRQPARVNVESYRFSTVKFRERPYEGRQVATFTTETIQEWRTFPAGSLVVRTDQRGAKVAVNLLEPRSPDSFVSWGFFNAIFEQKEYVETYVMERIGKRLLEENPALRKEFEEKIRTDTLFAKNPDARVNWMYQRSPWADHAMNVYPVGRVMSEVPLKLE